MGVSGLALLAALLSGTAAASPVTWSTSAYVRAALTVSPEVIQASERVVGARASQRSQWASTMLPSLSFSATMNPARLAPGGRFTFDAWRGEANDFSLSPALSWNIFNHFKDDIANRSNSLAAASALENLEIARQQVALEALGSYYRLLRAERLVEVAEKNRDVQKENYDLTRHRYQNGMKSLFDLLKTETDWRSAELTVENRLAEYRLALFQFNVLIEREETAEVRFEKELSLENTRAPDLDSGLRDALRMRPEMKRNANELEAADLAYRRAKIDAGPTVSLDFSYSDPVAGTYGTRTGDFGLQDATYGLLLSVSLPSRFNFYSQAQNLIKAKADWRISRQTNKSLGRSVRTEVYRAYTELLRSLRSYEISLRKEDISEQNLELISEQYKGGSVDVIRLSQVQIDFVNSQIERLDAFRDANLGRAAYHRAIGESIWR